MSGGNRRSAAGRDNALVDRERDRGGRARAGRRRQATDGHALHAGARRRVGAQAAREGIQRGRGPGRLDLHAARRRSGRGRPGPARSPGATRTAGSRRPGRRPRRAAREPSRGTRDRLAAGTRPSDRTGAAMAKVRRRVEPAACRTARIRHPVGRSPRAGWRATRPERPGQMWAASRRGFAGSSRGPTPGAGGRRRAAGRGRRCGAGSADGSAGRSAVGAWRWSVAVRLDASGRRARRSARRVGCIGVASGGRGRRRAGPGSGSGAGSGVGRGSGSGVGSGSGAGRAGRCRPAATSTQRRYHSDGAASGHRARDRPAVYGSRYGLSVSR